MIDGERVREVAFAFLETHIVCRRPRCDLDAQRTWVGRLGNHCELLSVQADGSLDRGCRQFVETTAGHHVSKKKMANSQCSDSVRLQCCRQCTVSHSKTLQQLVGQALQSRRGPQVRSRPWSAGSRSGADVQTCSGTGHCVANSCLRDGLRCALLQFHHVSHHEIIKATLAMGVPSVLNAAWIRKNRNSETLVKLDDIATPGTRRTRSVPQGDPCAQRTSFGAALDTTSCEVL